MVMRTALQASEPGLIYNGNNPEEKGFPIDLQQEILGFPFREFMSMTPISESMIALTQILCFFLLGGIFGTYRTASSLPTGGGIRNLARNHVCFFLKGLGLKELPTFFLQ
jgi:hypothetical protein